jgi:bifunctional DNA-binding transcriptional regulator/antitoxin component of YhaV-PrlF toxin-antitoxin module
MDTLTITAKGQVTLRKEVLRHLGVEPGAKVEVDLLPGGRVGLRATSKPGKISDIFGMLRREGQTPVSIEDINQTIADGWAGKIRIGEE